MDPITFAAVASTVATVGTTILGAQSEAKALEATAANEQEVARIEAENAEVRAKEERASGQQKAAARMREARLAQSSLIAQAGASGSSASDPTVLDLWGDIEAEGRYNESQEFAASEQKAKGITYQANLNRWSADRNAAVKRAGAKATRIGGYGKAAGEGFGMIAKYGGFKPKQSGARAYG